MTRIIIVRRKRSTSAVADESWAQEMLEVINSIDPNITAEDMESEDGAEADEDDGKQIVAALKDAGYDVNNSPTMKIVTVKGDDDLGVTVAFGKNAPEGKCVFILFNDKK